MKNLLRSSGSVVSASDIKTGGQFRAAQLAPFNWPDADFKNQHRGPWSMDLKQGRRRAISVDSIGIRAG